MALLPCDRMFFREIDSEAKAYMLGFLAADAAIPVRHGRASGFQLGLSSADEAHLLRMRALLGSTHKVQRYTDSRGSTMCVWAVASVALAADLVRHGVGPRKTYIHPWPSTVPNDLLHHFLRGYVDGDGSVYAYTPKGYVTPQVRIQIVSHPAFLAACQTFLYERTGAKPGRLFKQKSEGIRFIQYGGNRQVGRIAKLLYDGATIYLPRKYDRLSHLMKD